MKNTIKLAILLACTLLVFGQARWRDLTVATVTSSPFTNLPAIVDAEGGTIYGAGLLNALTNNTVQFSVNFLTNFWGDFSSIVGIGYGTFNQDLAIANANMFNYGGTSGLGMTATNSYSVFNYGDGAGENMISTNSSEIYSFGDSAGLNMNLIDSSAIFNYGDRVASGLTATNSSEIFNYGSRSGELLAATNSFWLFNYGSEAGQAMTADSASDIYSFGNNANQGRTFSGVSHIFVIGSGGKGTNSNDYVFGDSAYNYFFPGSRARFESAIETGGNTNRWILGAPETNNIVVDTTRFLWITNNGTAYKVVIAQ